MIRHRAEAAASRRRGAEVVEGTSGAADCVPFREGAQEAALEGGSSLGEACWASPFDRDRYRTVVGSRWAFRRGSTRGRDRRCPSQSGWGKSTAASGRRDGGREGSKSQSDPWPEAARLAEPRKGWSHPAAQRLAVANHGWSLGSSEVCSGSTPLQKSVGGMWPRRSGESRVGA
jgi:hypothetical protein